MNTTATLCALGALALVLAACNRTEPQGPGAGDVLENAAPAPPGYGKLKVRKIYDFVGDRAGTPWAGFEENGEYNYPEPIVGGWPMRVTPVDAAGLATGASIETTTLEELSPTDGRYLTLPAGRYRVEEVAPLSATGGSWAATGANATQGGATTPLGRVFSVTVEVVAGTSEATATVVRFFDVCRVGKTVQPFPSGAVADIRAYEWACRPRFPVPVVPSSGTFLPNTSFPTGFGPVALATGDLDKDGRLDLAAARSSANVAVLRGDGAGGFLAPTDYSVDNFLDFLNDVVAGDFDNDGWLDLAAPLPNSDAVAVLINNGSGGFLPKTDYPAGPFPSRAATADVNGDGCLDLLVTTGSSVSLLFGNGAGGFSAPVAYVVGDTSFDIAAGDLNGDGHPDVAAVNGLGGGGVSVLLNNGVGGFLPKTDYPVGAGPTSLTLADLNGDGRLDLALTSFGGGAASSLLSVLLNNPAGGFLPRTDYPAAFAVGSITAEDLNGDGRLDLATGNNASIGSSVSVFLNAGSGGLLPRIDYPIGFTAQSIVSGDFNGDNRLDLVVAVSFAGDQSVAVLLGAP